MLSSSQQHKATEVTKRTNCNSANAHTQLKQSKNSMLIVLIVKSKCILAASHAGPWWGGQYSDRQTDKCTKKQKDRIPQTGVCVANKPLSVPFQQVNPGRMQQNCLNSNVAQAAPELKHEQMFGLISGITRVSW